MTNAVFFDLDGTLYDRDALVRELVAAQFDAFSGELPVLKMDAHGYGEQEKGYQRLVADWQLDPVLAGRLSTHFRTVYDQHCHLSTDTATPLDTLRAHGKHLSVITNGGTTRQRGKLAALGLADRATLAQGNLDARRGGSRVAHFPAQFSEVLRQRCPPPGTRLLAEPDTGTRVE